MTAKGIFLNLLEVDRVRDSDVAIAWWRCLSPDYVLPKLLVVSGADRRQPGPVAADPRLHVVRSGLARADARPGLCPRAVSLRPRPVCLHCVEKHHARFRSKWWTMLCLYNRKAFSLSSLCFSSRVLLFADQIHNFRKHVTNNLNSPYDYNSVMHYGRWAALWGNVFIGFSIFSMGITTPYSLFNLHTDMPSLKMADQQ